MANWEVIVCLKQMPWTLATPENHQGYPNDTGFLDPLPGDANLPGPGWGLAKERVQQQPRCSY